MRTGHDPYGFADAARCNVLVLPISPASAAGTGDEHAQAELQSLVDTVRQFESVRLSDIPSDPRGSKAAFSTTATTRGRLLFDFVTSYETEHEFLSEFQVHRRLLGIIGVVDCRRWQEEEGGLAAAVARFEEEAAAYPEVLASRCYGFNSVDDQTDDVKGLVIIPSVGDTTFYLGTLLADFAGSLLAEFSSIFTTLESRSTVETPRETQVTNPFEFLPSRPTAHTAISSYTNLSKAPGISLPAQPIRRSSAPVSRSASPPIPPVRQPSVNMLSPGLSLAPPSQARTALGIGGHQSGNRDGFLYGKNINSQPQIQAVTPEPSVTSALKARKRMAGRVRKLAGDLYLLGGRIQEAVTAYNDAVQLSRSYLDDFWLAASLEALAVAKTVQVWASEMGKSESIVNLQQTSQGEGDTISGVEAVPYPSLALQADIADLFAQALMAYGRVTASTSPVDLSAPVAQPPASETAHPLIVSEAYLRSARFSYCRWLHPIDPAAVLAEAVLGIAVAPAEIPDSEGDLLRSSLRADGSSRRTEIAVHASQAYSPTTATLRASDRIRLLEAIAALFSALRFSRKEAWVTRELAALKSIEVRAAPQTNGVNGHHQEPPSQKPRRNLLDQSPELERYASAAGSPTTSSEEPAAEDGVAHVSEQTALSPLATMLERVCRPFGMVVQDEEGHSAQRVGPVGGPAWTELQLGVVQDGAIIAERQGDLPAAWRFVSAALHDLVPSMDYDQQTQAYDDAGRVFGKARTAKADGDLTYWGSSDLVESIDLVPLPPPRIPFEYKDKALPALPADSGTSTPARPFIHSATQGRAKTADTINSVITKHEVVEFAVTLRNHFDVPLDIQSLELWTSGSSFTAPSVVTSIPAAATTTVRISGTPLESGELEIRGCRIRPTNCPVREVEVPIKSAADEGSQARRNLHARYDRPKILGITHQEPRHEREPPSRQRRFLKTTVINSLPLLKVRSTMPDHSSMLLYEGEKTTFRFNVENVSPVPARIVTMTFTDVLDSGSRIEYSAGAAIAASTTERRTFDSDPASRPVFSWQTSAAEELIEPGHTISLAVDCIGKLGCAGGSIQVDYSAALSAPDSDPKQSPYTRRLQCDVRMTVHRALETLSVAISPLQDAGRLSSAGAMTHRLAIDPRLQVAPTSPQEHSQYCVLRTDIRNAWSQTFELEMTERRKGGATVVRQRLEPGLTATLAVRAERFLLDVEEKSAPLAALIRSQHSGRPPTSAAEERQLRESFMYRKEMIDRFVVSWQEVGSLRRGTLVLNRLRLSPIMLNELRLDDVAVRLRLVTSDVGAQQSLKVTPAASVPTAHANSFHDVFVTMTNNAARPVRVNCHLHVEQYDRDAASRHHEHPSRYVMFDGVLHALIHSLGPAETVTRTFPLCFLTCGRFSIGADVQVENAEGPESIRSRPTVAPLVVQVEV